MYVPLLVSTPVRQYERLPVCISVCPSVSTSVCMSIRLFVCTSVSRYICPRVCTFICPSVCTHACLYVRLFVCTSVCLYVHLSVCMSVCLYVCLSVCLYVCLSLCTSLHKHFYSCYLPPTNWQKRFQHVIMVLFYDKKYCYDICTVSTVSTAVLSVSYLVLYCQYRILCYTVPSKSTTELIILS